MRIRTIKSMDEFQKVAKALSIDVRMRIYELLHKKSSNINEIADELKLPISTVTVNIQKLEEADLITTENLPGIRGLQKISSLKYDTLVFSMDKSSESIMYPSMKEIIMPIGQYTSFDVKPPCGLASQEKLLGKNDDIRNFYASNHIQAQLIWFGEGYLEYQFPNEIPENVKVQNIEFSAEICSEAPGHNNNWPSDITLWINSVELGTFTSQGDYGGKAGKVTPSWWPLKMTQYGLLKRWKITDSATYLDNELLSDKNLKDLELSSHPSISIKIGIKSDAKNVGGMNLFGKTFGNYEQELILKITYY